MKRELSEEYYTASQVKAKLGINDSTLYAYVRNGDLQRIIPPGHKKQGYYPRSEVDRLARELEAFFAARKKQASVFSLASEEDIPVCVQITQATLGNVVHYQLTPAETRIAWLRKNPEIFYILKQEGEIVGYAGIIPMRREKIEQVLRDAAFMKDITPEEIEEFTPGKPLDLYVMTLVLRPDLSMADKHVYGARLIANLLDKLIELGKRGIEIRTLFARSGTLDGILLLQHMGFTSIQSETNQHNFVIEVEKSGLPIIQQYREALRQARERR